MNKKPPLKISSIQTRITFWILIIALVPLIISTIVIYYQRKASIREEAIQKLTAVRDLKVTQINTWLDNRIGDIQTIAGDLEIRSLSRIFGRGLLSESDNVVAEPAQNLLKRYTASYQDYYDLFIIDAENGLVQLSSNQNVIGKNCWNKSYFSNPMTVEQLFIEDVHFSDDSHKLPIISFSIPLYAPGQDTKPFGVLVTRTDLDQSLYRMLLDRTGMGDTGETLVVNREVYALNDLRWYSQAPLKLKISAQPAEYAAAGKSGVIDSRDYRGVKVLAVYTHLERMSWGIVAKQDTFEMYEPLRVMLRQILVFLIISSVCISAVGGFIARSLSLPLLKMTKTTDQMREGDFSQRIPENRSDELGIMARSFNKMSADLAEQNELQHGTAEIINAVVDSGRLSEFQEKILETLLELTGASLGVFYAYFPDSESFQPVISRGLETDKLTPFSRNQPEGEFSRSVLRRQISVITELDSNTNFTFKTFFGTIIPNTLMTIPIIVHNNVTGIISLARLKPFTGTQKKIIQQAWSSLNTGYANLTAEENTRLIADELQQKNIALKQMTDELQNQTREVQLQNTELENQKQKVEQASRLKSEFLSNMSHELRTPLNSILALSRVLHMGAKQKITPKETEYLEIIENNGKLLLQLINDILDLSKIEAGKMELLPEMLDINQVSGDIIESLNPLAVTKGLTIESRLQPDLPVLKTDRSRIQHILQNLIGNAIKFTTKGGITVRTRLVDEEFHIAVQDTGIGIPEENLKEIFEEFRQVDGSTSRQFGGTGLGLSIAVRSAELLGGRIEVESVYGEGSTFTLVILAAETAEAEYSVRPIPSEPIPLKTSQTILVVDDDSAAVSLLSQPLTQAGFKVVSTNDPRQALDLARRHQPFLITLDLIMPEMDGWEVLQALKTDSQVQDIPVVIISVSEDLQTGLALGAVGYLTKPVDSSRLLREVEKVSKFEGGTVALADDSAVDRQQIIQIISENTQLTVDELDGGQACLDYLNRNMPDLLLLDLVMPDVDGFEVVNQLRQDSRYDHLPIIIVTARDLSAPERASLSDKVNATLQKQELSVDRMLQLLQSHITGLRNGMNHEHRTDEHAHILIVEDQEPAILQLRMVLVREGYRVDVARNGSEALEFIQNTVPNAVILDLMMPDTDGFQVLTQLRSNPATRNLPALVLTAKDLTQDDLNALNRSRVQQLVQKGDVDQNELLEKVKTILEDIPGDSTAVIPESRREKFSVGSDGGRPVILLVEDNQDNRMTIKAILGDDWDIIEASDGEKGLFWLESNTPDLILLDMMLPGKTGYDLARQIKKDPLTAFVPIIGITAQAMKGDRERVLAAGCDAYLPKPVEPDKLKELVQTVKSTARRPQKA